MRHEDMAWRDCNLKLRCVTCARQAKYIELINAHAHLDFAQNQEYKFG